MKPHVAVALERELDKIPPESRTEFAGQVVLAELKNGTITVLQGAKTRDDLNRNLLGKLWNSSWVVFAMPENPKDRIDVTTVVFS